MEECGKVICLAQNVLWHTMYSNDLKNPLPLYKYVDDTTIFELCKKNTESVIQESVDVINERTLQNDMKLNPDKSQEIIISFSKNNDVMQNSPME